MKLSQAFAVGALTCVLSMAASALDVTKSVTVDATPDVAWKTIGGFCGIADWHPAIAKCELSTKGKSTLRTLTLGGGGTIVEKQLSLSNATRRYSYSAVESPLPVDRYKSTLSVKKSGTGSIITWTGSFVAKGVPNEKAVEVIGGIYDGGLASLQKKLAK
jgi:Polyketide cyclase / dehydrase and lipid transport